MCLPFRLKMQFGSLISIFMDFFGFQTTQGSGFRFATGHKGDGTTWRTCPGSARLLPAVSADA